MSRLEPVQRQSSKEAAGSTPATVFGQSMSAPSVTPFIEPVAEFEHSNDNPKQITAFIQKFSFLKQPDPQPTSQKGLTPDSVRFMMLALIQRLAPKIADKVRSDQNLLQQYFAHCDAAAANNQPLLKTAKLICQILLYSVEESDAIKLCTFFFHYPHVFTMHLLPFVYDDMVMNFLNDLILAVDFVLNGQIEMDASAREVACHTEHALLSGLCRALNCLAEKANRKHWAGHLRNLETLMERLLIARNSRRYTQTACASEDRYAQDIPTRFLGPCPKGGILTQDAVWMILCVNKSSEQDPLPPAQLSASLLNAVLIFGKVEREGCQQQASQYLSGDVLPSLIEKINSPNIEPFLLSQYLRLLASILLSCMQVQAGDGKKTVSSLQDSTHKVVSLGPIKYTVVIAGEQLSSTLTNLAVASKLYKLVQRQWQSTIIPPLICNVLSAIFGGFPNLAAAFHTEFIASIKKDIEELRDLPIKPSRVAESCEARMKQNSDYHRRAFTIRLAELLVELHPVEIDRARLKHFLVTSSQPKMPDLNHITELNPDWTSTKQKNLKTLQEKSKAQLKEKEKDKSISDFEFLYNELQNGFYYKHLEADKAEVMKKATQRDAAKKGEENLKQQQAQKMQELKLQLERKKQEAAVADENEKKKAAIAEQIRLLKEEESRKAAATAAQDSESKRKRMLELAIAIEKEKARGAAAQTPALSSELGHAPQVSPVGQTNIFTPASSYSHSPASVDPGHHATNHANTQ